MLEDIDTGEKVAHSCYTDMEQLDFQILLTDKYYYLNPSSIHFCFPIKIKKKTNQDLDTDSDLITVSITKYGSNKEAIPTISPNKIYQ